jgi:FkbM family methyltransferase
MMLNGSMQARWRHYELLITNLGLWQFLFYKLQQTRLRFFPTAKPVSVFSKLVKSRLKFRPGTSDHSVFFQIFVHLGYGCLDKLRDVNLIVDCGANVGYTSVYLLNRFPKARVVAVEPDPGTFAILKANLAPYTGRYRAICSAVWSHSAGLVFSANRPGGEWTNSVRPPNTSESANLTATDISTLLEESGAERISILKIDIEGAESVVFSSNYESWIKRVDNLVIELHGQECRSIFETAIAAENFAISEHGELTVCTRKIANK